MRLYTLARVHAHFNSGRGSTGCVIMRAGQHLGRRCTRKIGIILATPLKKGMVDVTMARSHARGEERERERDL